MTKIDVAKNAAEEQNYGGRVKQQRTKFRAKHEAKGMTAQRKSKKIKDRSSLRTMFI
jgi:hypothetical protein